MEKAQEHKKYYRVFHDTAKGGALIFGSLGALASGFVIATSGDNIESLERAVGAAALLVPITITAGAIAGYVDEKVFGPAFNYLHNFIDKKINSSYDNFE